MTNLPLQVSEFIRLDENTLLKAWMRHLNIKQNALASQLGVTQQTISCLCGTNHHRKGTIRKLSAALGIREEQLISSDSRYY